MPDFLRWIIAGVTSVVVAGLVFLLATVGIVVAFFVFLVLFVVFGLAMRRARKNVQYGEDGSRFIIYTNIPGAGAGNADRVRRDDPDTYELSPDEYTVEAAPSKKPGDTDPRPLEITGNRDGVPGRQVFFWRKFTWIAICFCTRVLELFGSGEWAALSCAAFSCALGEVPPRLPPLPSKKWPGRCCSWVSKGRSLRNAELSLEIFRPATWAG